MCFDVRDSFRPFAARSETSSWRCFARSIVESLFVVHALSSQCHGRKLASSLIVIRVEVGENSLAVDSTDRTVILLI